MKEVDKILASGSFGSMQAWAAEKAAQVSREYEMGVDFDFMSLGDARRKMLRIELVKMGYSVINGCIVRLKSGRAA